MAQLQVLILDGFVDEPGLLGVPPYLAPEPRKLVGVCELSGLPYKYITVSQYRAGIRPAADLVLLYGGVTVPGNYLLDRPLSLAEANQVLDRYPEVFVGGPLADLPRLQSRVKTVKADLSAYFFDFLTATPQDRVASSEELENWLQAGTKIVHQHARAPDRLLAEISLYHGCVRYFTGGCSFCSEPAYGTPRFRSPESVVREIRGLYQQGIRHFRIGGQSCIFSYCCEELGKSERPAPAPDRLRNLFEGITQSCPEIKTLHVDNANPAIIAAHPRPSAEIMEILVKHTTAGNVLAFGMESADPVVIDQNNLNATAEEVKFAVELTNKYGRDRGDNGMPRLLPGLNFIAGLTGETAETYRLNLKFLKELLDDDLWLRRINIRQVLSHRKQFDTPDPQLFKKFKQQVREQIDQPLLKRIFPRGTVIKDLLIEKHEGDISFGRQFGSYPLLVGVRYPLELDKFYDLKITEHGYRSLTAVETPLYFDRASLKQLQAVPGIGARRASKLFVTRPRNAEQFFDLIEDKRVAREALKFLAF